MKVILSLCDYSGAWSEPYLRAGYKVVRVDLGHPPGSSTTGNLTTIGADIRVWELDFSPYAVISAPPCTVFCRPSARWWKRQDANGQTSHDVAVMLRCFELSQKAQGWWALENPPGRHKRVIPNFPRPAWMYQPFEYGDAWWKQTYIWGTAKKPLVIAPVTPEPTRRTPNGKSQGRIAFMSSSWKRAREKTPSGFAEAFFIANP